MSKVINIFTWIVTLLAISLVIFFAIPLLPIKNVYKVVIVRSGSMEPAIKTGSISVYFPGSDYKKDEVIAFKNASIGKQKIATIHRIIEVQEKESKKYYVTKGDANEAADAISTPIEDVMGKVAFSVPFVGYLISWGQTSTGFVVMVVLPLGLLLYHEAHSFLQKNKQKKEHKVAAHHSESTHEGE